MTEKDSTEPYVIQIQRKVVKFDQAQIDKLRIEFRSSHCVRLTHLLEPSLLDSLLERIENGQWQTMTHPDIGEEYVLDDRPALNLLHFLTNVPKFRDLIESITSQGPLRRFRGRVYRMIAGKGHHDRWHDDATESWLAGMTLNLSSKAFHGGLFMLREAQSGRVLSEIANMGLGDALVFRITPELEHRISDLEGETPKTAFAGWFASNDLELIEELRQKSRPQA
ncbi:MAG TPA: hypothetical protein VJX23_01545 [Candidatus Binataceae bacterium]|nr:hypothetical protein [Candidatus Binataceae bacterium]